MKKQLNILLVLLLTLVLSSCFTSKDDIDQAKKDLWIIELENSSDEGTNLNTEIEKAKEAMQMEEESTWSLEKDSVTLKEEIKKIEINSLTDNQFLELDDLSWKNLLSWEVEITWKTLAKVDKIIVNFANETSDFPVDRYELKQFVAWSDTFLYRAFSRYETLDFWRNVYVFEAYSWDEVSKLELVLNVIEEESIIEEKTEKIYEDLDISTLPINEKFGNPVDLGSGKISYSDLNWLEIKRDIVPELTCEKLTSVLADRVDGWFFWNTCRPIEPDEWITFFVIRLDWDKYVYEKHYYLSYLWLYWIQELETGTGVTSTNIQEKNTELREKNEEFGILEITDELFKEILN